MPIDILYKVSERLTAKSLGLFSIYKEIINNFSK